MDKLKAGQRALGIYTSKLPKPVYMHTGGPDYSNAEICEHFKVPAEERFPLLVGELKHKELEIAELHKMLNEKDKQIDALSRPMVVRLDFWLIGIVALVFGAHYFGYM